MPANWSMVDNNFPTFHGDEPLREQVSALLNYMRVLVEQLKYQMNNLDSTNWNSKALAQMKTDTANEITAEDSEIMTKLNQLVNEVARISNRVSAVEPLNGRVNQAETDISYLEQADTGLDGRLTDLEAAFDGVLADIDELQQIVLGAVQRDADGNVTVGAEGKNVYLTGNVYVNGVLLE